MKPVFKVLLALLFLTEKSSSQDKADSAVASFLRERYSYSVNLKLTLQADLLGKKQHPISVIAKRELVSDFCYLYYLSEKEGKPYEVLYKLKVGIDNFFIRTEGAIDLDAEIELFSPKMDGKSWKVTPRKMLAKLKVPPEKEMQYFQWFEENWRQ